MRSMTYFGMMAARFTNGSINTMTRIALALLLCLALTCGFGCDSGGKSKSASTADEKSAAARDLKIPGPGEIILDDDLHRALFRFNPDYSGLAQIGRGPTGEIVDLTIVRCDVSDLRGLTNLRLSVLEASQNPIEDLRPLEGMLLKTLYLVGTKVHDVGPLAGMPLESLWLNDAPVEDISPLKDIPLESLTLEGTRVRDLRSLNGSRLLRLNIANTPLTDLTPLKGMSLTRLVFDVARIKKGLDVVRAMSSLNQLGVDLKTVMAPAVFWQKYDADGLGEQR